MISFIFFSKAARVIVLPDGIFIFFASTAGLSRVAVKTVLPLSLSSLRIAPGRPPNRSGPMGAGISSQYQATIAARVPGETDWPWGKAAAPGEAAVAFLQRWPRMVRVSVDSFQGRER